MSWISGTHPLGKNHTEPDAPALPGRTIDTSDTHETYQTDDPLDLTDWQHTP